MSKQWALREQRLRKASFTKTYKQILAPLPPVLSYTRLEYFQNSARAQHLSVNEPFSHLPDEVKDSLEEEWWRTVDDLIEKIWLDFYCGSCGKEHDIADVEKQIDDLRSEMERADVESIDGKAVEDWNERLLGIKKAYRKDIQAIECGQKVQSTVIEHTEIGNSTTTLANLPNQVRHEDEHSLTSTNNDTSNQITNSPIRTLSSKEIESNYTNTSTSRPEDILPHGVKRNDPEKISTARKPKRKIQRLDAAYLKKTLRTPKKTKTGRCEVVIGRDIIDQAGIVIEQDRPTAWMGENTLQSSYRMSNGVGCFDILKVALQ